MARTTPTNGAGTVAATGNQSAGATVGSNYIHREEDIVGVKIDDLIDFRDNAHEEFRQYSIGGFLFSGGFWLGMEQVFTVEKFWSKPLFIACCAAVLAGGVVVYFANSQLKRRKSRIDRIIENAKKVEEPTIGRTTATPAAAGRRVRS